MAGRLWQSFLKLDTPLQQRIDRYGKLAEIRAAILDYLPVAHRASPRLNPLDAALGLSAAALLNGGDDLPLERWMTVLGDQRQPSSPHPYRAYEMFKGKIPTLMIYGSPATTAAFVYQALADLREWREASPIAGGV